MKSHQSSAIRHQTKKGFTLVEMLVVIAVLSIIGILILTIFTRTLKGTNKSQILGAIKQNGQSVLETLTSSIRNADNVVCPAIIPPATTASSGTLVIVTQGIYTRYRFIAAGANNGLIQQDNPAKQTVAGSNPPREETDAEFVDRVCTIGSIMPTPIILTDTNPQSGVSLANGSFTRNRPAGFKDSVKVTFVVSPGIGALPTLINEIDPVTFETTIQLR